MIRGRRLAAHAGGRLSVVNQSETGVGAADIGNQNRIGKGFGVLGKTHEDREPTSGVADVVLRPCRRAERSRISAVDGLSAIGMS